MYSLQNQANTSYNVSLTYLNMSGRTEQEIVYLKKTKTMELKLNVPYITSILPNYYATLATVYPIKKPSIDYDFSYIKEDAIIANIDNEISVFVPSHIYYVNEYFPYSGLSIIYPK